MKKVLSFVLVIGMLFALGGCGSSTAQPPTADLSNNQQSIAETDVQETSESDTGTDVQETGGGDAAQKIDVDLTQLSSTMVYSEVYNMLYTPENYVGKTVKMNGAFALYCQQMDENGKPDFDFPIYYACVIADATACCSQGLEFVLSGEHSYPDDYPELGGNITVAGTFETYVENGGQYCHLVDAVIE